MKKKRESNILAEGEVTGHAHEACGSGVNVFETENDLLLEAPCGAEVVHQEHGTVVLPPGVYRAGQVLEFDPATEEAKRVQD